MVMQMRGRLAALGAAVFLVSCGSSEPPARSETATNDQSFSVDQDAQRAFWATRENQARLDAFVNANVRFALLHEAAHYLFDVLEVPVAGREEDAADRFAVALMTPHGPGNPESELTSSAEATPLVWVAYAFINAGRGTLAAERARMVWYNEHSPDQQRGYDITCLLYGSDLERFALMVHDAEIGIPSAERRSRCQNEARLNDRAFTRLLGVFGLPASDVASRRAEYAGADLAPTVRSGSAAGDILRGGRGTGGTRLMPSQPRGVMYHDYSPLETWWRVPWYSWDSAAFLRSNRVLESTRDVLLALRLPEGATMPMVVAHSCAGVANAFYGIDPTLFRTREMAETWTPLLKKGLLDPQITICYPLVDGFSWVGRALIWRTELQKQQR